MKALHMIAAMADRAEDYLDGHLQIACGIAAAALMIFEAVMVCIVGPMGGSQ